MTQISYLLQKEAEHLSAEWNNTGFIIKLPDGSLKSTVWNRLKFMRKEDYTVVASVNADGWKLDDDYYFEKDN